MSNGGYFVVSLDLELYWGMFDKVTLEEYGTNIRGSHEAIPKLLDLFAKYGIHATWAAVGMLMFENKAELVASLPPSELLPRYPNMQVSSYEHLTTGSVGESGSDDPYHYGSDLIRKIITVPHQELASHTFSHYYCLDGSENGSAIFAADCNAFAQAAKRFGKQITSIVFPRNQTSQEALKVCTGFGITAYRGTPAHFLYTGKKERSQTNPFLRILRLVDAYVNISGHHTYLLSRVKEGVLMNVIGSRFLRPYSHTLRFLERLRIARIKQSMTYAAQHGEIFHLWWHPHNFGIHQKENLHNLYLILEHLVQLQKKYNMQSTTMFEIATRANE